MEIVFWDTVSGNRHYMHLKNLRKIISCDDHCCIITRNAKSEIDWNVYLYNSDWDAIDAKITQIEPIHVSMNKTHVIIASKENVYYWQYRIRIEKTLEQINKECAFHIDTTPKPDIEYDNEEWTPPDLKCEDKISAITVSKDHFLIGKESGEVLKFSLDQIELVKKVKLSC